MSEAPTVIAGSRWKFALMGVVGFMFVMATQSMLALAPPMLRWMCVAFFGLAVLLGLWGALNPPRLTLDREAFHYSFMGRGWSVRWADVQAFHVWKNPAPLSSQKLVAWTYRPGREPSGAMAGVASSLGAPGALPGSWSLSPDRLLSTMQDYLERAR